MVPLLEAGQAVSGATYLSIARLGQPVRAASAAVGAAESRHFPKKILAMANSILALGASAALLLSGDKNAI